MDKKHAPIKHTIPITSEDIGLTVYPKSTHNEFDFIKNIEYEQASQLKESGQYDLASRVETSKEKFILFKEELKLLYIFMQSSLDDYVKEVMGSDKKVHISSSWVARNKKGQWTEPHTHQSIINGAFYFNSPGKSSPFCVNVYNDLRVMFTSKVPVKKNQLVLFPNSLEHWVPKHKDKETRYCVAFNTQIDEHFKFGQAQYKAYEKIKNGYKK